MTLEHAPDGDMLMDPAGKKYLIRRRDFSSQVILRPEYADEAELTREFKEAVRKLEETGAPSVRLYI